VSLFEPACSWEEKIMVVRPTEIRRKKRGKSVKVGLKKIHCLKMRKGERQRGVCRSERMNRMYRRAVQQR
jgi:hypothetical protein